MNLTRELDYNTYASAFFAVNESLDLQLAQRRLVILEQVLELVN